MRNWRVVTAVVTVVLAALAGVLIYTYVNRADERAQDKVRQVSVLVATQAIPASTTGADAIARGLVGTDQIPRKNVPDEAIAPGNRSVIRDLVAATNLPKGTVLTSSLFVERRALGGALVSQIAKGKQAISLSVDQPHGVANLVQPGDSINMLVSLNVKKVKTKADPTITGEASATVTAFLMPGLKVLAVGTSTGVTPSGAPLGNTGSGGTAATTTTVPQNQGAQNLGLITVEVTPRQAEQLAQAQALNGIIYLSLNAPGFDTKTFKIPAELVDTANLFDQPLAVLDRILAERP